MHRIRLEVEHFSFTFVFNFVGKHKGLIWKKKNRLFLNIGHDFKTLQETLSEEAQKEKRRLRNITH